MKFLIILIWLPVFAFAAVEKPKAGKRLLKNLSFDKQLVEGEVYRPDYSVVTGEAPGEGWGVLKLRKNFNDHTRTDSQLKGSNR